MSFKDTRDHCEPLLNNINGEILVIGLCRSPFWQSVELKYVFYKKCSVRKLRWI